MADPVIGQQIPNTPQQREYTQPGGIGTPTFPQQTTDEMNGRYYPGCGHSITAYDVRQQGIGDPPVSSALACCPLCGFLQTIVTPYSDFINSDTIFLA
jgi:hypothetical protein